MFLGMSISIEGAPTWPVLKVPNKSEPIILSSVVNILPCPTSKSVLGLGSRRASASTG